MKTVSRKAIDPETDERYQIDFPAPEEVEQAILGLEFPSDGIRIKRLVPVN